MGTRGEPPTARFFYGPAERRIRNWRVASSDQRVSDAAMPRSIPTYSWPCSRRGDLRSTVSSRTYPPPEGIISPKMMFRDRSRRDKPRSDKTNRCPFATIRCISLEREHGQLEHLAALANLPVLEPPTVVAQFASPPTFSRGGVGSLGSVGGLDDVGRFSWSLLAGAIQSLTLLARYPAALKIPSASRSCYSCLSWFNSLRAMVIETFPTSRLVPTPLNYSNWRHGGAQE